MPTTSTERRKPITRLTTNRASCTTRTSDYNRMTMMWGTTKTGQTMPVPSSGPLSSFFFSKFILVVFINQTNLLFRFLLSHTMMNIHHRLCDGDDHSCSTNHHVVVFLLCMI